MSDCVRCARPMADQAYACEVCGIQQPAGWLGEMGEMLPAARDVAQGQTSNGTEAGAGKPGSRIELVFSATARLDAVQNELVGLVRQIAEERGRAVPLVRPKRGPVCAESTCGHPSCAEIRPREPLDAILAAVGWLPGHLEWLRHRQEVSEALTTIDACARVVRGIAGPPRRPRYLGPCGAPVMTEDDGTCPVDCACHTGPYAVCDEPGGCGLAGCGRPRPTGEDCQGDVYGRDGAATGRCRSCGAEYDQVQRRRQMDDKVKGSVLVARASVIADSLNLSEKTIYWWATPTLSDTGAVRREAKLRTYWRTDAGRIVPWTDLPDEPGAKATERRKRGDKLFYVADVKALAEQAAQRRAKRESEDAA